MKELGLQLTLSESPPISAPILGVNLSPDGNAELLYVKGYLPGYGVINESPLSGDVETIVYRVLNPRSKAFEIVDFREPHHMDDIRKLLETLPPSNVPHPRMPAANGIIKV